MTLNQHIGIKIKAIRRQSNLTQKQLGELLGMSGASVAYLEKGQRKISPDVLNNISQSLETPISYFYEKTPKDDSLSTHLQTLKNELEKIQDILAQTEKQKSEAQYKQNIFFHAFSTSTDGIAIIDNEGNILHCNQALSDMYGYDKNELIGMPVDTFDDEKDCSAKVGIPAILKYGSLSGEFITKRKDGSTFLGALNSSTIVNEYGHHIGLVGIIRDVTKEKNIAEELRLFKQLMIDSNDAVFIIDPKTSKFLDVNKKACATLGYSEDELLKMTILDVQILPTNYISWQQFVQKIKECGTILIEGYHKKKSGSELSVNVNIKYIKSGQKAYLVEVARYNNDNRTVL